MRTWRSLALAATLLVGVVVVEGCASSKPSPEATRHRRAKPGRGGSGGDAAVLDVAATRAQEAVQSGDVELTDAVDEGMVSFYHDSLAGNPTANGERYRLGGATCAHKTLPFGTIVVIEDTDTGKVATCRVNDRGPFVKGRVLDVSRRVARELGIVERGVIRARLRLILPKTA
ncbi:MAG: septal ring lytic transglycosylase RlpA family protein [Deltaproteobacteria bacterium]|nr:septal ring lytic transglycosylase RlpA family protein [Deltaproteobacteria bacterium]